MVDYRNYKVWQLSHQLVLKVYPILKMYPQQEQNNLVDQLKRAVVSIPTNIAEGCGKETQKELIRYLYIASGSAHEVEYLLFLSKELGYLHKDVYVILNQDIVSIKRMLAVLIKKIKETVHRKLFTVNCKLYTVNQIICFHYKEVED